MCATQMNTNDNPELWDIQLSSWLFCKLRVSYVLVKRVVLLFFQDISYDARA